MARDPLLALREAIEPGPKDVVRARVQQCQPQYPLRMALRIAKTEKATVVMRNEVEAVQTEGVGQRTDPFDLGVVGGRRIRRFRAPEAGPIGRDDAVVFGKGGDLMSPTGRALRISVQQQHGFARADVEMRRLHFVQSSIKFAICLDVAAGPGATTRVLRCGRPGTRSGVAVTQVLRSRICQQAWV